MKLRRYTSITFKLVLPVIVVLVAAVGIMVTAQYLNNRRLVFDQVQNAGTNLLEILEETLVVSPELFREDKLKDIVLRFAQSSPGVVRLSIADRSLTIIADSDTGRIGRPTDYDMVAEALRTGQSLRDRHDHGDLVGFHVHHLIRGAYDPGKKTSIIGVATIEISAAPIEQELDFAFVITAMVVTAVTVFIGFAIYYFVRYLLISPIDILNTAARRFGQGDFAHKIELDRRDEIGELAATLNRMSRDLASSIEERKRVEEELVRKERLAAVGQLTATVSHELRNPLGAIRSALDAIKQLSDQENPKLQRAVALLDRSQLRVDKVIEDLLNYTRVRELNRRVTKVDEWLGDLVDDYKLPTGITLRREFNSSAESALDRDRLQRAVSNVIDNACQAMENGVDAEAEDGVQCLTIATRVADAQLELTIGDTGPGIPAADREKIFEPLYSTKSFGVGLGLPMVKQIVEQHGGGIEFTSEVGRGTRFVLRLPLHAPEQGAA